MLLPRCPRQLAKDQDYLVKHLLGNLPSLAERVQQIRTGKAATAAVDNDRNLEKSQVCRRCRASPARACSARGLRRPDAATCNGSTGSEGTARFRPSWVQGQAGPLRHGQQWVFLAPRGACVGGQVRTAKMALLPPKYRVEYRGQKAVPPSPYGSLRPWSGTGLGRVGFSYGCSSTTWAYRLHLSSYLLSLRLPQEEYRKGVSSWNFDLVALKAQAALEPDDDSSAHGNSLLPTISESDEREDTLSEQGAAAAAMFVAAQQGGDAARGGAAGAAPGSYTSAFGEEGGAEYRHPGHQGVPVDGWGRGCCRPGRVCGTPR